MFSIRVTATDGTTRTIPFSGNQCSIGRTDDNDVVLEGEAISSRHCVLEVVGESVVLKERGSTNGTFLNNHRLVEPSVIGENDRIYVGDFLLQLARTAPAALATALPQGRPILRQPAPNRLWRDLHGRFQRYADEWEVQGRPARLTLAGQELREAKRWLKQPGEPGLSVSALQRHFIEHSERVARKRETLRVVGIVGAVIVLGLLAATIAYAILTAAPEPVPETKERTDAEAEAHEDAIENEDDDGQEDARKAIVIEAIENTPPSSDDANDGCHALDAEVNEDAEIDPAEATGIDPDKLCADVNEAIQHKVIPFETLDDVARRYGVSVEELARENLVNPDEPVPEGKELSVKNPSKRPLPQARIEHEVEPGESWTTLAERFGVPATRLRDYNPGMERLDPGKTIAVWLDPKPYQPREPRKPIPEFHIDKQAISVGAPNAGRLENGMEMPESDAYTRLKPNIMWGSALTIYSLRRAIAAFRQDVDFNGVVILADISQRNGGHFPPHKSHQAGRDIDIWLPTLQGVAMIKELGDGNTRRRKPLWHEVDWYATWGLVRALIQTGNVQYIFLDWRLQKFVYDAAVNMGATPEELDEWIQYPRHAASPRGIFRHSKDHLGHIHVRFKCAQWEPACRTSAPSE